MRCDSCHIPDHGSQTIRYYGRDSNAFRGKAAKRQPPADQIPTPRANDSQTEWITRRKANWAALIKLIYESDPLLCPKCCTPMRIISLIRDPAVIDKILDHLQYRFDVLPLSTRPPPAPASTCPSDFLLDPLIWNEPD